MILTVVCSIILFETCNVMFSNWTLRYPCIEANSCCTMSPAVSFTTANGRQGTSSVHRRSKHCVCHGSACHVCDSTDSKAQKKSKFGSFTFRGFSVLKKVLWFLLMLYTWLYMDLCNCWRSSQAFAVSQTNMPPKTGCFGKWFVLTGKGTIPALLSWPWSRQTVPARIAIALGHCKYGRYHHHRRHTWNHSIVAGIPLTKQYMVVS